MEPLSRVFSSIGAILSPLIIGVVIAYLCDPILEFFEYRVFGSMHKGDLRRGLSLFCTLLSALAILALIALMILPQLYQSISGLLTDFEHHMDELLSWIQGFVNKLPVDVDISSTEKMKAFLEDMFGSVENALSQLLGNMKWIADMDSLIGNLGGFLMGAFNAFKNVFLGIFIAFYILASKEKRVAQFRKFRRAVLGKRADGKLSEIVELTDHTFGGFIFGKILDSMVIGILTFVLLTIFDISPYNILIATFVGITNIIPVFGPFIGAIPSFLIVLISQPSKAFLFLLLILIIQQIDGNIIGPKILGDNTGISSLCVIISISICSALWGVVGMIIGVPVFAVIIEMVKRMLERKLTERGLPTDTLAYYPADAVGNAEEDIYYEHSHLLYYYRHSKLKPIIDRIRYGSQKSSSSDSKKKKKNKIPKDTQDPSRPTDTPSASPRTTDTDDSDNIDPNT